jgi:hypothetical protein
VSSSSKRQLLDTVGWWSLLAFLLAVAACVAYPRMFSTFAVWDDEGYLLVSLRSFLAGGALYDQVYTQYGPFYYLAMGLLFEALGLAVTHDSGRLVSLALWLLASGLCAAAMRELTGRLWVGALVLVLTFGSSFQSMAFEPMHPGVLVCALLAGLVASTAWTARRPQTAMAMQGAICAALLLVKINVGGFAILGVALAYAASRPGGRRAGVVLGCVAAACLAAPLVLMTTHLEAPWVQRYVALATMAIATLAIGLWRGGPLDGLSRTRLLPVSMGGIVVGVASCAMALLRGTSPRGLLDGVLLEPLGHARAITVPLAMPQPWAALAAGSAGVALLSVLPWPRRWIPAEGGRLALGGLGRCVASAALAATAAGLYFGRPLGFYLAPLATLAVAPPFGSEDSAALRFARKLLPAIAVMQILHAYPVAGSQVNWAAYLLLPVAGLLFADGAGQWGELVRRTRGARAAPWLRTLLATSVVVAAGAGLGGPIVTAWSEYQSGSPVDLPGFGRARLAPWTGNPLVETTQWLRANCRSFYSLPGLNSFHLWTGIEPRTGLNGTRWPLLFDQARQRQALDAIRRDRRACLVRLPVLIDDLETNYTIPEGPLRAYVADGFETRQTIGPYEVAKRRVRQRPSDRSPS